MTTTQQIREWKQEADSHLITAKALVVMGQWQQAMDALYAAMDVIAKGRFVDEHEGANVGLKH